MRLKNILLALALPFLAAEVLYAQRNEFTPDSLLVYYTDGVRLAVEQQPAQALEKLERALAINPDHDPSLYEAANSLLALGEIEKALEYSARAVALDSGNHWYEGQRARILVSLDRLDEALPLFEAMLEGDDFDPDNYRVLALIHYRKGQIDEAIATLAAAEVRMGATSEIVDMKRGLLLEQNRVDEAISVTESYVSEAPFDEENRLVLSELYAYKGRDSLAVETLKEVLHINPDNTTALDALAARYRDKGDMALFFSTLKQTFLMDEVSLERKIEKLQELRREWTFYRKYFGEIGDLALTLARHHAGDPEVARLYADHAARGGDAEGALEILKTQLERPSPPLEIFMKTIEIEAYLKRADSVARYSAAALSVYPDAHEIYLLRASALQFMEQPQEARKVLTRALRVATTDSLRSELYGAIGNLWHEEGKYKQTFVNYEKALRYNSDNALVLNNYAYYLAVEGRELDRALGMASRAVKLQENFATYLDTYAWVLYKTGDYAEAKRVMQQALPLDREGSAELLVHYGDILWALDDKVMASIYWKRARDAGYEPVSEIEERLARGQ